MNRILFLLIFFFFSFNCGKANETTNPEKNEAQNTDTKTENADSIKAPDFTFENVDGNIHTLSDYKGKVVVLNFWVIHCPACRVEISGLMKLNEKHKDKELVILGIGIDKNTDNLKAFSKYNQINYPILLGDMATAIEYSIKAVPTTFVMNREGDLTDTIIGYNARIGKKLEERLLELLENEDE